MREEEKELEGLATQLEKLWLSWKSRLSPKKHLYILSLAAGG